VGGERRGLGREGFGGGEEGGRLVQAEKEESEGRVARGGRGSRGVVKDQPTVKRMNDKTDVGSLRTRQRSVQYVMPWMS
jgi:hypothetical protein